MKTAREWIHRLQLEPHIEGGFFRQILKSDVKISENSEQKRALYTSIYFLLEKDNPSHLHQLTADEVWYFHEGSPLTIHLFSADGAYRTILLGKNIEGGEHLQAVVPGGTIFGSSVEEGYALVSCMVSPGFQYEDFRLMKRGEMLEKYPMQREEILRLTREDGAPERPM